MRRADRSPGPSPRDECGALPEGSAEGKAAQKKPARPRLGAWEGEVNPDAVNEILLDYIRAYDQIEMEDQEITEIQQAERLGMKRQRLEGLHIKVKTVTIPTFIHWCNARHINAHDLLHELTADLPHI
jgi:hypothetical protein